ncbi:DNA topoisomerase IB [Gloeobacter kilaueensis]|uniref:DNA topoisomerase n=1 Tax=Gloeobacter kilaueensis (strain ATCC BAA-2537 / CCAP 1431/1 / ULC 316 / JS1) TaxID=1183438 RepID=U5QQP3_GLOK1|nr:DNA topoisomerase IB [Gloeobacter kilaueensis]AGY59939.1 DNA topoisomerase I [Gloeobacter kilaueensis JS1]
MIAELAPDPLVSARAAGLRYVSDRSAGIRRHRRGKHFSYIGPDGKPIRDEQTLERIRKLAIPPAYTDVWICPHANGHLQATGRDGRGRKQYRYHLRWRAVRDETKYGRTLAFGTVLPAIRGRTEQDLARPGLPREKVLAAVVRLLESTLIRVGNEEYARQNDSYGLTTLRDEHVEVKGSTIRFQFRGKSGKDHTISLTDRRLARVVKRCQDVPGQELFQYIDADGERQTIDSADVNAYLREIAGEEFTAKDFRTWAGTVLAALALQEFDACDSESQAKKNIVQAIGDVARRLGNTPTVCRKCYIHPAIIDAYLEGTLLDTLRQRTEAELNAPGAVGLRPEERAVLAFLQKRLAEEDTRDRAKR